MKKIVITFMMTLLVCTSVGCRKIGEILEQQGEESKIAVEDFPEADAGKKTEETGNEEGTSEEKHSGETLETSQNEVDFTFVDLSKSTFEFCSGAGAWSTDFNIEKDGYFHGNYCDSDMGDSGEDYPDGTRYVSIFSGHFTDLKKVDEFTYEMTLSDISYEDELGTEELSDNVKYVYTDAYGLAGSEQFKVYLPGKAASEIGEEVAFWLQSFTENGKLTTLCIENVDQAEGIYSHERMSPSEEADTMYKSYKSSYDYWNENGQTVSTTTEMYFNEERMYKVADDCLNDLWTIIKYNTDESAFQTILEEQRAWLKERDETVETVYNNSGGTMAKVDAMDIKQTITMQRCEELLQYIE